MPQPQYPKAHKPNAQGQDGTLQALILHQHQQAVQEAQKALEKVQAQHDQMAAENEEIKKKKELDDKLLEDMRKELDQYKSQFDSKHILEKKTVRRETMQRARLAKGTAKKQVKNVENQQRKSKQAAKSRASSQKPRKAK